MKYQAHLDALTDLENEAGDISGSWNGDEAGRQEERAHIADEIVGKVNELKDLVEFLRDN